MTPPEADPCELPRSESRHDKCRQLNISIRSFSEIDRKHLLFVNSISRDIHVQKLQLRYQWNQKNVKNILGSSHVTVAQVCVLFLQNHLMAHICLINVSNV